MLPTQSLDELREEMARKRAAEHVEAERVKWRDLAFTAAQCLAWAAVGIFLLMWSVHTTDVKLGKAAFFAGLGVGNAGIIFSLLGAYRRGEERGDW
jgi:hypothetical protein